jgi:hypothetical protein
MNVNVFSPNFLKTKTLSASATTANVTLDATDVSSVVNGQTQGGHSVMRIVNAGPNTVFLRWGTGIATAALTTDMPVLSGAIELFSKQWSDNWVSGICAGSGTATVYITCGEGL